MNAPQRRKHQPAPVLVDRLEPRLVLSHPVPASILAILRDGGGAAPLRPNTPVLPATANYALATFLDPTVRIRAGQRIAIGQKDFIAPHVLLDGLGGYLKVGDNTTIQDHATLVANPTRTASATGIVVGDNVAIGDGAHVIGPASIGADNGSGVSIGANATIDGATVEPGAAVGPLARVGPGVTIPSGFRVLPGANVTSTAEASDPALGKVVRVESSDVATLNRTLSDNAALASGYSQLYEGNSATGGPGNTQSPIPRKVAANVGYFFGSLRPVEGIGPEPGSKLVSFEPAQQSPQFVVKPGTVVQVNNYRFPARVTGQVVFGQPQAEVGRRVGPRVSIRGDEGQPITVGSIRRLGRDVSIHAPTGGTTPGGRIIIGRAFRAGAGAVILGGSNTMAVGDNVAIGSGAVVAESSIGTGATVGDRAYVSRSTIAPGAVVPDRAIVVDNVRVGTVGS